MSKRKSAWRIWAKALGAKEGTNDREADIIAGIRTIILISYMVTNVAIVANAIRHWNNNVIYSAKTIIIHENFSRYCRY
jgi:hypothetical protein